MSKELRDLNIAMKKEILNAAPQPSIEPAPGYCKHCKQYTIEEPLPAPSAEPVAWWMPEHLRHQGKSFTRWIHEGQEEPLIYAGWVPLYTRAPDDTALLRRVLSALP